MKAASDAGGDARSAGVDRLLACYRDRPGVYDEMLDAEGGIRPHWRALIEGLAALGDQAPARFAAADRYLKDSGVFYHAYDGRAYDGRAYDGPGSGERPWPLAPVPIMIAAEDWAVIRAGALQRAQLLEAVLADAYGPGELVARGLLPAAAIAGSPEYLRPLAGSPPPGGRHLAFYAIDLARASDGRWWAVADRAQAPSGAGYALENRGALARALSDLHPGLGVRRLGRFFDRFRGWLDAARNQETGADDYAGPCLLTPGRLNETYFEHAYLARQLGVRLVEGQDLTVRDHRLYLRTIAGLKPVGALWRRVDSDFCDPLELNRGSQLGVPGLVQAVRRGHVVVANALGSGLAEAPSLLAFLPALAEAVTGRALLLPNVATWWCGQAEARGHVLDQLDRLSIASAFGRHSDGPLADGPVRPAELDDAARTALRAAIAARGMDYVGQESVTPSTTPVWVDGRLEPRPFLLRVFVAATADGWSVMPGGFALIGDAGGDHIDTRALSIQRGARSADVWVQGDGRQEPVSPPAVRTVPIRRTDGALPSRAADNLFWSARYLARAEATLRIIRALARRLTEHEAHGTDVAGLAAMLAAWGAAPPGLDAGAAAAQALFATGQGTVSSLMQAARMATSVVRDRFPGDAFRALDELDTCLCRPSVVTDGVVLDVAGQAIRLIAAVNGFQVETMNRLAGWHFLQLGHQIERAIATCRFVRQLAGEAVDPETLDALLELAEARETYRSRYLPDPARRPVLDLVLMDETNPRALAYAASRVVGYAASLPAPAPDRGPSPALAIAQTLAEEARALDPATLSADRLIGIENRLMQLSNAVSHSYFTLREPAAGDAAP